MFRIKWIRLLTGGVLILFIGIYITIRTITAELSYKHEKYTVLDDLSYDKLSDDMLVMGNVSRVIGKYTFDLGGGNNTYFVTALPSTTEDEPIKYISINPKPSMDSDPYHWWNTRVEQWTEYFENGTDPQKWVTSTIACKLHKTSDDSLTEAYKACGSYVSQGDILPYYAEPYHIDFQANVKKPSKYPIGAGIATLVLGAGMIAGWIIHYVKTKSAF